MLSLTAALAPTMARADINLVPPGRTIDPAVPFRLSLMVTGEAESRSYALPEVLRVNLTPDLGAVARVELRRETPVPDQINLRQGEFRRIDYVGEVPPNLRGRVRVDAVDMDAPAMLVQLSTPREAAAAEPMLPPAGSRERLAQADAAATPDRAPATVLTVRSDNDPNRQDEGRLSFHEPMFFVAGAGVDANAQIQLSFKLRLYEPADKNSRRFLDNLYFAYTQAAFWDLTADSKPFLDTNYIPSFFYYVPNTDWRVGGNAVGIAAGYEHESNGKDGSESRSIDTLFVRPYFTFGDTSDFYWTFSPKIYAYIEKSENPDIQKYRGYGDFRFTYGKNDDWQTAWILRKGTKSSAFSSDLQFTYPLNKLLPGLSGYLMAQYFTGYGETLLNYNQREPWSVRIGYAISR
ncbi:MAG TPA: phospholipase A [Candidatus Accumulibacter phosphatis]|nr:phospholipase A [Candidatus Accumulibacter phosphatis]HRQ96286.1 phospholipase A [Candidatus Accumulibacter phosphatis]